VVIDLTMPHLSGRDLLPALKERYPGLPVIVMTGRNDVEIAVECMRAAPSIIWFKPVEPARFVSCIRRAMEIRSLQAEVASLKEQFLSGTLRTPSAFAGIGHGEPEDAGRPAVHRGRRAHPAPRAGNRRDGDREGSWSAAPSTSSAAAAGSWVTVNVAGLDDTMLSDTLFGHRKGAYTRRRPGAGGAHLPGFRRDALPSTRSGT